MTHWVTCRGGQRGTLCIIGADIPLCCHRLSGLPGRPGLAGVNGSKTPAAETSCKSLIRSLNKKELMAWSKCHLNYFPSAVQGCDCVVFFLRLDELQPHLKHCSSFLLERCACWLFPTSPLNIYSGATKWLAWEAFGCWRLLIGDQKIHRRHKDAAVRAPPPPSPPAVTLIQFFLSPLLTAWPRPSLSVMTVAPPLYSAGYVWLTAPPICDKCGGSLENGRVISMQGDPAKVISTPLQHCYLRHVLINISFRFRGCEWL